MHAQFHERQIEMAANFELASRRPFFFPPALGLEEIVAFDVAMTPSDPRIWRLLGLAGPPPGAPIAPQWWPGQIPPAYAASLPTFSVSLFLQYKRPEFMTRANAGEWSGRRTLGHAVPYYRFWVSQTQHRKLRDLEQRVLGIAEVRYAAPLAWRAAQFWALQLSGRVFMNSTFPAPSAIGSSSCWTYSAAGRRGVAFSEPTEEPEGTVNDVLLGLSQLARAREPSSLRLHISELASRVLDVELVRKPRDRLRDELLQRLREIDVPTDEVDTEFIADVAVITETAAAVDATWFLLAAT